MAGIFQGLELAKRALLAHQFSLTTAGHNIANADTPGYTRQRADLSATDPDISTVGRLGSGVRVTAISQIRDLFLTGQFRQGSDQLGRWTSLQSALSQVEGIVNEPSDTGLSKAMNDFFGAWQLLSQNPESAAARASVREQAVSLVGAFHQASTRLSDLEKALDNQVVGSVNQINQATSQIAQLNQQIQKVEVGGGKANDLRDRRDKLIDDLSQIATVNVIEESTGAARVFLGTMEIVSRTSSNPLSTQTFSGGVLTKNRIVWQGSSLPVTVTGGQLAGQLEARDKLVPQYRSMLDQLAGGLVSQINTLHFAGHALDGTAGHQFFNPNSTTAAGIALSNDVLSDVNLIAASQSGAVGDNANALAIANLQHALTLNNGTTTFGDFFGQIVGTVGTRSAEAKDSKSNAELVVSQIEFSRQSIQGVSLDEEMANLIESQHAYAAAARVISTIDSSLNTLINDMGVGR